MSDDTPTGRDLVTIWRTVTVVAIVVCTVGGSIVAGVIVAVRLDGRLANVEKWQANRDQADARELWRRERERERERERATRPPLLPGTM